MLNAIEGSSRRGAPAPAVPASRGLHGKPTVVDNVETLVNVPWIMLRGARGVRALGTAESLGHEGAVPEPRLRAPRASSRSSSARRSASHREKPAAGGATGSPLAAVLLGGPMGSVVLPHDVGRAGLLRRRWRSATSSSVTAASSPSRSDADFAALLRHWLAFMRDESCGKCVPCGIGSRRAVDLATNLHRADARDAAAPSLRCDARTAACAHSGSSCRGPLRAADRALRRTHLRESPDETA